MKKSTKQRKEQFKRRFNEELARVKERCLEHNLKLYAHNDNYLMGTFICVLSIQEMQIGDALSFCDDSVESYFLTPHDYEIYHDLYLIEK